MIIINTDQIFQFYFSDYSRK